MLFEKMNLKSGKSIYPRYLAKEDRERLKSEMGADREYMWCACRSDKKLYYLISESLSLYPAHKGYEHAVNCKRYTSDNMTRNSAFVTNDNDDALIYLKFNPKNFSMPEQQEEESNLSSNEQIKENCQPEADTENKNEKDILPMAKKPTVKQDITEFSLDDFIRCINNDTIMQYMVTKGTLLPVKDLPRQVYFRLLKVRANKSSKSISSLTLDSDGVRFFYAPYKGVEIKKNNNSVAYSIQIQGNDNKTYGLFTFSQVYEKALKKFIRQYGIEPDENTMVAGFQYLRKSKKNTNYKVVGRMHLFQVNQYGVYCRTIQEMQLYDAIYDYLRMTPGVQVSLPIDDPTVGAIIEVEGGIKRGMFIFPTQKAIEVPEYDTNNNVVKILDKDSRLDFASIHNIVLELKGEQPRIGQDNEVIQ